MFRFDASVSSAVRTSRVPRLRDRSPALVAECRAAIQSAVAYSREHFEDPPEIREWVWPAW